MRKCKIYFTLSGKIEYPLRDGEEAHFLAAVEETIQSRGEGPQWLETLFCEGIKWEETEILNVSFSGDIDNSPEEELDFD